MTWCNCLLIQFYVLVEYGTSSQVCKIFWPRLIYNEKTRIIYYASTVHTTVQFLSGLELAFHMCSGMIWPGFDPDAGTSQAVSISMFYLTSRVHC